MARLGYSEQEIAHVSDRLLDALVGYGERGGDRGEGA